VCHEADVRKLPRFWDTFFLLVGLALLAYVLSRVPMAELWHACLRVGPLIAVTPIIALGWFACNTFALWLLVDRGVPWSDLLRIRLTGDGYNALLPLAGLGGEPYKIRKLSEYVPTDRVLTALIRDRVIENAVGFLFTALWLAVALFYFVFSDKLRIAVWSYVAIAAAIGIASTLLVITSLPSKLSARVSKWLGLTAGGDVRLSSGLFARVLFWYMGARCAGTLEVLVLFRALGYGFDPLAILFAYSFLNAAGFVGGAIPQGIGVFEGATVYMFETLGFGSGSAVAFAFARRARMLIVGLIGVALHLVPQPDVQRARR
jgi:hypothetical protein